MQRIFRFQGFRSVSRHALFFGLVLALSASTLVMPPQAHAQNVEAARLYNRGIDLYNKGNIDNALSIFQQAAQADPNYPDTFYNLGTIYFKLQNFPQAESSFARVTQLNVTDHQARFNLGLALEKQSKWDAAMAAFTQIPQSDALYGEAQNKIRQITAQKPQPPKEIIATPAAKPINTPASAVEKIAKVSSKTMASGFFGPTGITTGGDGLLYVANYSKNIIYQVNASGEKKLFAQGDPLKGPVGLIYNATTKEFYAANYLGNSIAKIATNGKVSTLLTGLKKPYYLSLDPTGKILYVSEQETNTISKVQLAK